jgi:hypothetical protein
VVVSPARATSAKKVIASNPNTIETPGNPGWRIWSFIMVSPVVPSSSASVLKPYRREVEKRKWRRPGPRELSPLPSGLTHLWQR